jgi:hypothetical protein
MGLSEVSNTLWRERQMLSLLLFKLEVEQLLLSNKRTRFLSEATREVEIVINEVKETELLRAVEVDALAAELGLGPSPSLRELAASCPSPWDNIFEEHRKAFLELTTEIFSMAEINRSLLADGDKATRDALEWLQKGEGGIMEDKPVDAYSSSGSASSSSASGAKLVDEAL